MAHSEPHTTAPLRSVSSPTKKTLIDKIAYGIGSVAFGVKDNGFSVLLMLFYNQVLGVPAKTVGLALMLVLVFDAITDPFIGTLSDRCRSKWGRRHPFMYAAAIPVALSYLALWMPPVGLNGTGLVIYLVVVASLVRTFISLYEIPSSALVTDLSSDYNQRTSLLSYRFFFGWWGGLVMSILAFSVFLRPNSEYPVGQLNPQGYVLYGVVASAIMLIAILVSAIGTHRHIPSFKPAPPKRSINMRIAMKEIGESIGNRPFLVMIGAGVAGAIATGLAGSILIYMRTYLWGLTGDQISFLIMGNFGSTVVALLLAPRIAAWLGKKNAAIAVSAIAIVNAPLIYILRLIGWMPDNGTSALLIILFASSFVATVLAILAGIYTASMIADVVEYNELRTGRRSDGLFFSANGFIMKALSGVGVFATGVILDFVAFPQGAKPGEVPNEVFIRLILTEAPTVACLQLIALAFLIAYPINQKMHEANLAKLEASKSRSS